jgi:hypothetical protein
MFPKNKLRLLDTCVLAGYATAVLTAVAHHEQWTDEAQAWLIARDMPFLKMMFSEMHYEGSPGLWHVILWVTQHVFHAQYQALNWIGAAFAIAGAGLLIFLAPFPRVVRYLMAFSYYLLYQYAVIARPYVLLLLCGGIAAIFYRRRNMLPLAVSLAIMCGISLHGAILAGALAAGAAWHSIAEWKTLTSDERTRLFAALAIVSAAFVMVFVIAYPAHDVTTNHLQGGGLIKLVATLADVVIEPWGLGAALLIAIAAFTYWGGETIPFVLGVGGLLVFQSFVYGGTHHEGTIVVGIIIVLWIAWPKPGAQMHPVFALAAPVVLCLIFGIQTIWAVDAWRHELAGPYSGAQDAAKYLHETGADHARILGYTFEMAAIQAYYDRNLFENWTTSYAHHSLDVEPRLSRLDGTQRPTAEYIVILLQKGDQDPDQAAMEQLGYRLVHTSPGRIFFKYGISQFDTFVIYRKAS